jgi:hypothetical protein
MKIKSLVNKAKAYKEIANESMDSLRNGKNPIDTLTDASHRINSFNAQSRKPAPPKLPPGSRLLLDCSFTQSRHFRGFKRINLSTHGDTFVTNGIQSLKSLNPKDDPYRIDGRTIRITIAVNYSWSTTPTRFMNVDVDGCRIGTVYRDAYSEYIDLILSGKVDRVFTRIEECPDGEFQNALFIHKKE